MSELNVLHRMGLTNKIPATTYDSPTQMEPLLLASRAERLAELAVELVREFASPSPTLFSRHVWRDENLLLVFPR
jgi:hypothetical protein